ncbi:UbiD family decarboxylase [Chloroflexota bacterium]
MPYQDLREYLDVLRERGELKVCHREVDRKIEIAKVTDKSAKVGGPAILFENVKGFKTPVVTGLFGTMERCFQVIDSTKYDAFKKMQRGLENLIPCKRVQNGPCKEVIKIGEEIDLLKIPVLWHQDKDSHYYITATNVIAKDPDTGVRNSSVQRMAVIDKNKLGIWINAPMDLRIIIRKYLERGKPCPIAVAVGTEPVVLLSSCCRIPYGVDELEFAGGVRGEPVEMVECETLDLDVPATSELVIEGEIIPGDEEGYIGKAVYCDEGPFAELTGYYGAKKRSPLVHVKAITHRKDFIYHGLGTAVPPSEIQTMTCFYKQADVYGLAKTVVPAENIRAINMPLSSCSMGVIISIKKTHPGQAKQVIYAILNHAMLKRVIVVDEDIDVFDAQEVDWAVTLRTRAEDYVLTPEMAGHALDPMVTPPSLITKVGIDATLPLGGDKKGSMEILRDLGPARYPDLKKVSLEDYLSGS